MKGSQFVFDSVDQLYYKLQKKKLNGGGSYIDPPKWLKNKKAAINPTQKDDACFLYTVAVAPIHEQIKSHPERI